MKKILIILVISQLSFFIFAKDEVPHNGLHDEKEPHFSCVELSKQCSICSDKKKRVKENGKYKEIESGDYDCAKDRVVSNKSANAKKIFTEIVEKLKDCKTLSDFCAICKDGSFLSTLSGNKINSDLYECSTSPRTQIN